MIVAKYDYNMLSAIISLKTLFHGPSEVGFFSLHKWPWFCHMFAFRTLRACRATRCGIAQGRFWMVLATHYGDFAHEDPIQTGSK